MRKRFLSLAIALMVAASLVLPGLALAADTPAEKVELEQAEFVLQAGDTATLKTKILPSRTTDKTLTFTSSKKSVATVDEKGVITALKKGTATITVEAASGVKAKCTVKVVAKGYPTAITLNHKELTLALKGTDKLTASFTPADTTKTKVSFSSSNKKIVKVDSKGNLTGLKEGTATITAKASSGVTATCVVTVSDIVIDATRIALSPAKLTVKEGEKDVLSVTLTPTNATRKGLTFTSSNTAVATVDQNGNVTGVNAGTATITAKLGKVSARCSVTVQKSDSKIAVQSVLVYNNAVTLEEKDSFGIEYEVFPLNATDKAVTFTSSNASIATVDKNGKVTGVKAGTATITVQTTNGKKSTCKVTVVKDAGVQITRIRLEETKRTLDVKDSFGLEILITPANATATTLTFASSDTSVARVDKNGLITGVKAGTATITVTAQSGVTASCVVTVVDAAKPAATGIRLYNGNTSIPVKDTFYLEWQVLPVSVGNTGVSFTSSDSTVASVDAYGKVTALRAGTTQITATTANGHSASITVTVQSSTTPEATSSNSAYVDEVIRLVNIERAAEGLAPLSGNSTLHKAAAIRAQEASLRIDSTHRRPDGREWHTVLSEVGGLGSMSSFGENLAAGQKTPADVVAAWMSSPGHRQNIMNSNYKYIGVGYFYTTTATSGPTSHFWAQIFGG